MTLASWLTIVTICTLGAMSPGPSLAVVLRQTINNGRRNGLVTAAAHGLGIGFYAFASISGIAVLITRSPWLFSALQWGGAAYLIWLGLSELRAKKAGAERVTAGPPVRAGAARDGFLIAFLNPKVAIFFIALFSQVIGTHTVWFEKLLYAATAMLIDTTWYVLVAWLFSNPRWLGRLQARQRWLERIFGVVLIALALRLAAGNLLT